MKNKKSHRPYSSTPYIRVTIDKVMDVADNNLKAFASVTIGNTFVAHGIKVVTSDKKGLCVLMPQRKYTNTKGEAVYKNTFHAITKNGHKMIVDAVLKAYDEAILETQYEDSEIEDSEYDYDMPFEQNM